MGLFGEEVAVVDASMPDGEWFAASEALYRQRVEPFYGSPDTMAAGGYEHYQLDDYGTATLLYAKSIDMLHSAYGFQAMANRRPSDDDLPIVEGFTASLEAALGLHPAAPVAECVREATHRLRSISAECDRLGLPSNLYRSGLKTIGATAPQVRVDDVLWV